MTLVDVVGSTGTLIIVLGYLGTQTRRLDATTLVFPVINLVGALLISVSLWFNFNLASALMEVFWISISLFGIFRWLRDRRRGGAVVARVF